MSLTKQIKELVDKHTRRVVESLAEKYEFDAKEAMALAEGSCPGRRKATSRPKAANPFMRFSRTERPLVKKSDPGMPPKDVLREIGRRWRELSAEDKLPYQRAYEDEKAALSKASQ